MALPAVLVKAAASLLMNTKEGKNAIKGVMIAVASPFILVAVIVCCLFSAGNSHNDDIVALVFGGGELSSQYPAEYADEIRSTQSKFAEIDEIIEELDVDFLDAIQIKSYFFALYFGESASVDVEEFVDHFVIATRTLEATEGEDGELEYTLTYGDSAVADMSIVYQSIMDKTGVEVTEVQKQNAMEIYYRVKYGVIAPTYGDNFDDFISGLPTTNMPFVGLNGFVEPVADWRNAVSSEYGYRTHPITGAIQSMHSGIDIAKPAGTPIYSVLDGVVTTVRWGTTGYGYYVMVDHGGGFATLYAHCSKLLVSQGQTVSAGQVIAQVGTTGSSTGNHLHFETRVNGSTVNPRTYLP